eukprot:8258467-Prorocentrum_lima.AAC.1
MEHFMWTSRVPLRSSEKEQRRRSQVSAHHGTQGTKRNPEPVDTQGSTSSGKVRCTKEILKLTDLIPNVLSGSPVAV